MKGDALLELLKEEIRWIDKEDAREYKKVGSSEFELEGKIKGKPFFFNCTWCTSSADYIAKKYGGVVMGYAEAGDVGAEVGEGAGSGGHDFAIIDDRFIVDWWNHSYNDGPAILDYQKKSDRKLALKLYGDSTKWEVTREYRKGK